MLKTRFLSGGFRVFPFLALATAAAVSPRAQVEILLWPSGAPGAKGTAATDKPSITPFPAPQAKANGAAMVVFPGGAYRFVSTENEGVQPAKWLNGLGVSAFIVKYRLGSSGYRHPIEMGDGQRAIRWVRAHAKEYGIDPKRVGVLGFSAGGHLASTVSTHFDSGSAAAADSVDRQGCRPDWSILGYPVITMDAAFTHAESRSLLLGDAPAQKLVDSLSNEKQVTSKTPPAFLFHAKDDNVVLVKNAQVYYDSLVKRGVAAQLKLYEKGGHGFGLADGVGGTPKDATLATWSGLAAAWMDQLGFFKTSVAIQQPGFHQAGSYQPGSFPAGSYPYAERSGDADRGFGFRWDGGDRGLIDAAGRTR